MDTYHILNFNQIFSENAFCLSQRLGIEILKEFSPQKDHTYIIFGAHEQAATLYLIQISNPSFKYIIINSEPPQSDVLRNKYYLSLMKNNIVLDYHTISSNYLKSLGIRVFGQYCFEFPEYKNSNEREIDILFVGSKSDRRETIYTRLQERYPDKKIEFHFDWKYLDQQELTKLLHRAKIVLNIPYYNSNILETHRINKALSCGCKVVSLFSGHEPTDKFYADYIYFTHDLFDFLDEEPLLVKRSYAELLSSKSHIGTKIKWILSQLSKN